MSRLKVAMQILGNPSSGWNILVCSDSQWVVSIKRDTIESDMAHVRNHYLPAVLQNSYMKPQKRYRSDTAVIINL